MSMSSSSGYAFHTATQGGNPLSLPTNTPAPPGFALPDASQRIEGSLSASQGVSSLFSLQQISYFNSFVEQVRSADKDGRRQLVAFIADETLKALDGTSTHLLTRVGRSAYLKNVREWFRTRVRKTKQEYGYGHSWKGREVYYRLNVAEVMSQYREMVSSLPGGKSQAISTAVPMDAEGLQIAAADDEGEEEEEDIDKALSSLWNPLPLEEKGKYHAIAQEWRAQGPTAEEKRRLADKDIGSITAAFQTDLFVQMGALSVTAVAWVNTSGEMEIACLEGHPRLIGRSFKRECLGAAIPGFMKTFGTWAHPILTDPAPPDSPVDPARPHLVLNDKGKRKFVWPRDTRGVPILSQSADLLREGEPAWVVLPAATRSYIGQCYDAGDKSGASLPPPYTYMATDIRVFLSEQSLPDEFVKSFTGIGDAGVPALTSLINYWYGLQERGVDPLVFKVYAIGTGERKCLRRSVPREVFRTSDLNMPGRNPSSWSIPWRPLQQPSSRVHANDCSGTRTRFHSRRGTEDSGVIEPSNDRPSNGLPSEIGVRGRVTGNAAPPPPLLLPTMPWPHAHPSIHAGASQEPGRFNGLVPNFSFSQVERPRESPQVDIQVPSVEVSADALPRDSIEQETPGPLDVDEAAMAMVSPPTSLAQNAFKSSPQSQDQETWRLCPPGRTLSSPYKPRTLPLSQAPIDAQSMGPPHNGHDNNSNSHYRPVLTAQTHPQIQSHLLVGPSAHGGRRTELQILQEETRERIGEVPARRVRRVRVRDG
ncbi:hypothetical protein FA13DRAFT_1789518 [Coprinellus micaceus]|uniref:Uncharacterized protein n=1 Tax=Coprinellus micaceus TaxID=71717 RepID=A0A4Y7TLK9_COPMI|nr:hypothetical protein FA13DRAFT_1789518 [Coprinellus micaceus]